MTDSAVSTSAIDATSEVPVQAGMLLRALSLNTIAMCDVFTGESIPTWWGRLFGGQILGQAVFAATNTVSARFRIHSIHGYFILAGRNDVPVLFRVERVRDGRSFATRIVNAIQENKIIFTCTVQFHRDEQGLEFSIPITETGGMAARFAGDTDLGHTRPGGLGLIPSPEELLAGGAVPIYDVSKNVERIEVESGDRWLLWWGRVVDAGMALFPDTEVIHPALLAYMSDMGMVTVVRQPHERNDHEFGMTVTLDHAIHFHRPFRADTWLLFHMETIVSYGARGLARGHVYTQDGTHVASLTQEALIREGTAPDVVRPAPAPPSLPPLALSKL